MKIPDVLLEMAGLEKKPPFGLAEPDDVRPLLTINVAEGDAWEVVLTNNEIIVLGQPADEEDKPEDERHNCDAMGCGCWHVLGRSFLPEWMRKAK